MIVGEKKEPKQLVIRLDLDLYRQLKEISEKEDRSMAGTIRYALRKYIAENEVS